eukprot:TRINITY_DN2013_c0_g1_i1.p1 TRINITY_DN2013_c0_g1~~TRINITY_DN2013_c0_g1_i1.p1  ORF type:complete len:547 (+),score=79.55 TRINITY_DN2013_c0_g1_i1:287-1927(+)
MSDPAGGPKPRFSQPLTPLTRSRLALPSVATSAAASPPPPSFPDVPPAGGHRLGTPGRFPPPPVTAGRSGNDGNGGRPGHHILPPPGRGQGHGTPGAPVGGRIAPVDLHAHPVVTPPPARRPASRGARQGSGDSTTRHHEGYDSDDGDDDGDVGQVGVDRGGGQKNRRRGARRRGQRRGGFTELRNVADPYSDSGDSDDHDGEPIGILFFRSMASVLLLGYILLGLIMTIYGAPTSNYWQGMTLLLFMASIVLGASLATVQQQQWVMSAGFRKRSFLILAAVAVTFVACLVLTVVYWEEISSSRDQGLPFSLVFEDTEYTVYDGISPGQTKLGCDPVGQDVDIPQGWKRADNGNTTRALLLGNRFRFGAACVIVAGDVKLDTVTGQVCNEGQKGGNSATGAAAQKACYARTLLARPLGKPQAASWVSHREVISAVSHQQHEYAILNQVAPNDITSDGAHCHDVAVKLPSDQGWRLAGLHSGSRTVAMSWPWGGACLVFADGSALQARTLAPCGSKELLASGNGYYATRSSSCDQQILIERTIPHGQ